MLINPEISQKVSPSNNETAELPSYLKRLNPSQLEAALAVDGPLIVLAGAGSGKTRMVTSRICHLIAEYKVPPYQILAVTFTNKAAQEMTERVNKELQESEISNYLGRPEIGTFHSICVRILRREKERLPFQKPFVIYDDSDQLSLIKSVMKKLDYDPKALNPKAIQAAINRLKCDAKEPQDLDENPVNPFDRKLREVYTEYQAQLITNSALDFGEIICITYRLLRDHEDVRKRYQDRFRYIHVDEYQDTNRAQYLLLAMLASAEFGGHANICVVGDEDQSIYKWRGADIRNILDFEKDFGGAQVVKLEQNYRSTKTIIEAADSVIRNNTQRKDKHLWTDNEQGDPIRILNVADERMEAEFVINEIKRLASSEGCSLDDFAVFYRTHAQSRQFEDVLRREKLNYKVVGGLRFYDRKEIKDILAYFRVILNPQDSVSLKRVINTPPRGIGKTTLDRLDALSVGKVDRPDEEDEIGTTPSLLGGAVQEMSLWEHLKAAGKGSGSGFSKATETKLAQFVHMIEHFQSERPKLLLSELYHLILDRIGYVKDLREEGTVESLARVENLEEFDNILQEFEEDKLKRLPESEQEAMKEHLIEIFIEESSLASVEEAPMDLSSIKLMSLHGAKGLEFPYVFMVGMEEGLFPSTRPWEEEEAEEIEEERRLCYVGMTRAMKRLYMLHANMRRLWGQFHYHEPARFLSEMTHANAIVTQLGGKTQSVQPARPQFAQSSSSLVSLSPSTSQWTGQKIHHPEYGAGEILQSEGSGAQEKVLVKFRNGEKKKFVVRFIKNFLQ